jgi:small-conductance mechanosensitive channel
MRGTALILAAVVVSLLALPLLSDQAAADPYEDRAGYVVLSLSPNSRGLSDINAGGYVDIYVHMYNEHPSEVRYVEFVSEDFARGHVEMPDRPDFNAPIELRPSAEEGSQYTLHLRIVADRYLGSVRNVEITFMFVVYDSTAVPITEDYCELTKTVNIFSGRASENQFNKVMGIVNNPFPSPFDIAIYAAAVTLLIWLGIAAFVLFVLLPRIVMPLVIRDSKEGQKDAMKKIKKPLLFIILLYGITVCVAVMGAGEQVVSTVEMLAWVIYILMGVLIVWKMVVAISEMLARRKEETEGEDHDDSLTPLIMMIIKIIIGMVAVGAILAVLGFDTMIIATGAGIIGLAISFGAQSTLAQFFSGFTLLINRPFRVGDLVRLDSGTDTLRVLNVGFMMTTFRNWANSEIFTMPNQKVVSSTIINVTAESLAYRIIVLVRVPYGTNVSLAKTLALEAMTEHPRILQDGSEEIPKVRLEEFSDSSILIRVSGFVDDFEDHRSIAGEIREGIYTKYRENEITIAIPKMDIYVKDPSGGERKLDI